MLRLLPPPAARFTPHGLVSSDQGVLIKEWRWPLSVSCFPSLPSGPHRWPSSWVHSRCVEPVITPVQIPVINTGHIPLSDIRRAACVDSGGEWLGFMQRNVAVSVFSSCLAGSSICSRPLDEAFTVHNKRARLIEPGFG